jgi:hypothetical protein
MCKKEFDKTEMLIFKHEEFLNTINVDNENFYSDHLVLNKDKLISSDTLVRMSINKHNKKKHRRKSSFDLENIMRSPNSLDVSSALYS